MSLLVLECLLLFLLWNPSECNLEEHREFQYKSLNDGSGTYNFAYDTSHQPRDAHSLHMEYRDANGIVRGRYGYTDPRGNLRMVEYEAGPDGFKARGDVGPDLFPHMEAPGLNPQEPNPAPTPLRMAGWDPETDPINKKVVTETDYYSSYSPAVNKPSTGYSTYSGPDQVDIGRPSYSPVSQSVDSEAEVFQQEITTDGEINQQPVKSEPLVQSKPLTVYNIDVDPDEIRAAATPVSSGSSFVTASSGAAYPQRRVESIKTSPNITYYERLPSGRIRHGNHYDDYDPRQNARYYYDGQRIKIKHGNHYDDYDPRQNDRYYYDGGRFQIRHGNHYDDYDPTQRAQYYNDGRRIQIRHGNHYDDYDPTQRAQYSSDGRRIQIKHGNHYDYYDPTQRAQYHSDGHRIETPRQIRYVSQPHDHSQQSHVH